MKSRLVIALLLVPACSREAASPARQEALEESPAFAPAPAAPRGGAAADKADEGFAGGARLERKKAKLAERRSEPASEAEPAPMEAEEAAPARSWFPESFLFEPRVVTDPSGNASLAVRVPDRLTTWRVLALAHTREGQQAGAVTSFLGTLPVYVEPVVPASLYTRDEVRIPVQVVNTTEARVSRTLVVRVDGGTLVGAPTRSVSIPGAASIVESFVVRADRPGELKLTAALGADDAIERIIPVRPRGRLEVVEQSGTLAAPRDVTLTGPPDLEPETAMLELVVFPGALSVLRTELATAIDRGTPADDAYALLLSGKAGKLIPDLGGDVDPAALRELRIVAAQRAIRHARVATLEVATLLAEAALAHPDQPVLSRLGERLLGTLIAQQRPDGTWGGQANVAPPGSSLRVAPMTLQRLLVTTAEALQAIDAAADSAVDPEAKAAAQRRARAAHLKANAAFERNLGRVEDAYTAAVILASGGATGGLDTRLRARVREAVQTAKDGARFLAVGPDVVRSDGAVPSVAEASAVAALALQGDPEAPWVADLGATVLGSYRAGQGWGDGRANLWCLRAVLALFREPLPEKLQISVSSAGRELTGGVLDAKQLKDVLRIEAPVPKSVGAQTYRVTATPAMPGLGFTLALRAYVPWRREPERGLALAVEPSAERRVGRAIDVVLAASAPAGRELTIEQTFPAGVAPDTASLDALVAAGTIRAWDARAGAVTLEVPALAPGSSFHASYRVVPTLAGTLATGPATIRLGGGESFVLPPQTWVVRP